MIPLRDTIPSRTVPVVNYFLIGANVLAFFYEISLGERLEEFIHVYGMVPERVVAILSTAPQYLHVAVFSFFSSMFLHGGWLHLIGNMLYLYIFGDNVEDALGHVRYLFFYLAAGASASLAHLATHLSSNLPTVGASGAIAGVLGAYFIFFPRARVVTIVPVFFFIQMIEIPAFLFLGFWFVLQFLTGTLGLLAGSAGAGVAWWSHIGGFAVGILYALWRYKGIRRPAH